MSMGAFARASARAGREASAGITPPPLQPDTGSRYGTGERRGPARFLPPGGPDPKPAGGRRHPRVRLSCSPKRARATGPGRDGDPRGSCPLGPRSEASRWQTPPACTASLQPDTGSRYRTGERWGPARFLPRGPRSEKPAGGRRHPHVRPQHSSASGQASFGTTPPPCSPKRARATDRGEAGIAGSPSRRRSRQQDRAGLNWSLSPGFPAPEPAIGIGRPHVRLAGDQVRTAQRRHPDLARWARARLGQVRVWPVHVFTRTNTADRQGAACVCVSHTQHRAGCGPYVLRMYKHS